MSAKVDALALKNRMELFGPEVGEYIFRLESKVSALESALARERESRKQAEAASLFKVGDAVFISRHPHIVSRVVRVIERYELSGGSVFDRNELSKPIPQEPAERESGK